MMDLSARCPAVPARHVCLRSLGETTPFITATLDPRLRDTQPSRDRRLGPSQGSFNDTLSQCQTHSRA
jgi:hypothetical protein